MIHGEASISQHSLLLRKQRQLWGIFHTAITFCVHARQQQLSQDDARKISLEGEDLISSRFTRFAQAASYPHKRGQFAIPLQQIMLKKRSSKQRDRSKAELHEVCLAFCVRLRARAMSQT